MAHSTYSLSNRSAWLMLLTAALITMFLFFIDEGYYNFNWMTEAGGWIIYGIYVIIILGIEVLAWFLFQTAGRLFGLTRKAD